MTSKELLKLLNKDGWTIVDVVGSHYQLIHPTKKGKITVPFHSKDLPPGTLNKILKQAELK